MKGYDKLIQDLAPRKFGKLGQIWVAFLVVVILCALYAYYQQLTKGLSITHLNDYALWGVYISNFVFFVAVSLVGSLVTAILRLSGVTWSTPLTRISEVIAVAAIMMGGLTIIIDMGRPDRIYNIFLHGRLQSPIIWDVLVITTYLMISLMLLFYPLLPDFAILKKHFADQPKLSKWYGKLSLNWTGNKTQERLYNKSINALSIMIIPVAFGIHTVTAWLFATTYRPGWDSSNFGPYFIAGAFVAGAGAVVVIMYILRKVYHLEEYITEMHFDKMGKLLVLLCLVYLYFNVNEYLVPAYKTTTEEAGHLYSLFLGDYALMFWSAIIGGLVIPTIALIFPQGRKPLPLFIIGIFVVVGAWWKRFIIVTPTLLHPFLPFQGVPKSWHTYFPSGLEWMITFGTLAAALLIMTLLFRYLPIIPIHETAEEKGLLETHKTDSL
ncbi:MULTISPECIES: NrfD/PsrC family molybdoenzyme membrane anchor subunit [unclassified Flavobacterium]|jgi:molybdopterin-containing oxidoreductase family membrane subunit|uniref:NrfD/PsrC family molybdoenzyme membrane anchor subunit n=1 Tax=unclassified Flavobacterium TaxID=196869 RepID=UPI0025BEB879|nr:MULTISPECIES: NrfD/PsrC family molybdoenzyme membrane anchor subunit [unclassified Flavobacterium]